MSLYSDRSIRMAVRQGDLGIVPFSEAQLQPSSYDVRLDNELLVFDKDKQSVIDPRKPQHMRRAVCQPDMPYELMPGEMILGSTQEIISVGSRIAARLEGKSSLGRLGLLTHATAGFIDPGFSGHVTLELANVADMPILLWAGMKIGQICVFDLTTTVSVPYGADRGSHYQGQRGPTASRSYQQFKEDRLAPA